MKDPKLPSVVWIIASNNGQFVSRKSKSDAKKTMRKMIAKTKQWPEVRYVMEPYIKLKEAGK